MSSKAGYIVSCSKCHKEMGVLDTAEYFAFVADEHDPGQCFDCEPFGAGLKPMIFRNMLEGDDFQLGEVTFRLIQSELVCGGLVHERTHERTRLRGLSSYTNLNRNTKNLGVLENLYDDRICPGCNGLSFNHDLYGVHPCEICGDKGSLKVLKKWVVSLIGGVVEHA